MAGRLTNPISQYSGSFDNVCPIGSIIAWISDGMPTTPTLPNNWVICDGRVITDTASAWFGMNAPFMNTSDPSEPYLLGGQMDHANSTFAIPRGAGLDFTVYQTIFIMRTS